VEKRAPTTLELLALMDANVPAPDFNYLDIISELGDMGIENALQVSKLDVTLLATFGMLGLDRAKHVHSYARKRLLKPLGLWKEREGDNHSVVVLVNSSEVELVSEEDSVELVAKDDSESVELVAKEDSIELVTEDSVELVIEEDADIVIKESISDNDSTEWQIQLTEEDAIIQWLKGVSGPEVNKGVPAENLFIFSPSDDDGGSDIFDFSSPGGVDDDRSESHEI
jgi:hypothetical protein